MYLDVPYRRTGLSSLYPWVPYYYTSTGQFAYYGNPYPVAGYYLEIDGFEDFLNLAGSIVGIEITRSSVFENPQLKPEWWINNRRSAYTEKVDWDIESLDKIIESGDHDLIHTLWHTVVHAKAEKAEAVYRANRPRRGASVRSVCANDPVVAFSSFCGRIRIDIASTIHAGS